MLPTQLVRASAGTRGAVHRVALVPRIACLALLLLMCGVVVGQESAGRPIAFVTGRDGNDEIYVINPDGSGLRNLSQHPANDTMPKWSPDGTRIAFLSDRDGATQLYVTNSDGTEVASAGLRVSDYEWGPDGQTLAGVVGGQGLGGDLIWLAALNGSRAERVGTGHLFAWSPDGSRMAIARQRALRGNDLWNTLDEVVLLDLAARSETLLHDVLGRTAVLTTRMYAPVWLRDASGVLSSYAHLTGMGRLAGSTVLIVSPDGLEQSRLDLDGVRALSASPDGRLLLFTTIAVGYLPLSPQLSVTAVDGTGERVLGAREPGGSYLAEPSWAADSRRLVAELRAGPRDPVNLYIVPVDGSPRVRLTTDGGQQPDWRPAPPPPEALLPSMEVVSPTATEQLPAGSTSLTLEVRMRYHSGPWQRRLNSAFPSSGPGGGFTVQAGTTATVGGLRNGGLYSVHVAPVDANGDVLTPHYQTSRLFSVAPSAPSPGLGRTWIAFSGSRAGRYTHIYVARPDGSELTQITWGT
ncbi:MAG: hypothetical protein ABGY41_13905 [Candidatus Poribacteria bacterium]